MSTDILQIAKESMKENKNLLDALGSERSIKLQKEPDSEIMSLLKELMPKSTEGKIAAIALIAAVAWLTLKK